jgi:hypothetical protein
MSSNINVYIGPYIEFDQRPQKKVVKIKRYCKNHPQIKQEQLKFCGQCGEPITTEEYNELIDIGFWEIFVANDLGEDDLHSPEYQSTILMANESIPNGFKISPNFDDCVCEFGDNYSENIEEQITWFKERFSKHIQLVKDAIGERYVHIKYGVITYWS